MPDISRTDISTTASLQETLDISAVDARFGEDVEMQESSLVEERSFLQLSQLLEGQPKLNYQQQELSVGYSESLQAYSSDLAFSYLLNNDQRKSNFLDFKSSSIEQFVQ